MVIYPLASRLDSFFLFPPNNNRQLACSESKQVSLGTVQASGNNEVFFWRQAAGSGANGGFFEIRGGVFHAMPSFVAIPTDGNREALAIFPSKVMEAWKQ
jgi:hypothetical protein